MVFLKTLLSFWKALYTIPIIIRKEASYFPSSARTFPTYLNFCLIFIPSICNLHLGLVPLRTVMHSVFLQSTFPSFFSLFFITFCRSSCSFLYVIAEPGLNSNQFCFVYFVLMLFTRHESTFI